MTDLNAERPVGVETQFISKQGTYHVTCVGLAELARQKQGSVLQMQFRTDDGLMHYARVGDFRLDQLARATGHTDTYVPNNLVGKQCYITLAPRNGRLNLYHIHATPECDRPMPQTAADEDSVI